MASGSGDMPDLAKCRNVPLLLDALELHGDDENVRRVFLQPSRERMEMLRFVLISADPSKASKGYLSLPKEEDELCQCLVNVLMQLNCLPDDNKSPDTRAETMPTPAIRTLVPFMACNSTDECAVVDESATCAERLCFCPSFEPLAKGTRCNTTRPVFPLALGNNCTAITDCSSTAACVEGQCRCPDGYQPSDGHNCSVIRQSDFAVTSWFAITILASSILLILMLVFYLCLVGYR
ncbi:hypothetical protein HPB50_026274 [Hyalomma asiaticum]|uniref:Uncharacterized protein n=1 Tax=Hyalomma asiaticum TaxID=266040 RepID=A0ACB7SNE8_HYAAI|nr:hypothetical protein HPB50_026274 [Hyalomma asiaticum]